MQHSHDLWSSISLLEKLGSHLYMWYLVHSFSIGIILFQDEHQGQEIRLWGPGQINWKTGLIGMPPLEVCFITISLRAQEG